MSIFNQKQGIEVVSLYYSATIFDAFRVFSRPLSRYEAYYPITYRHPETRESRESMAIIPPITSETLWRT